MFLVYIHRKMSNVNFDFHVNRTKSLDEKYNIVRICLTGGPCAGKTTAIASIKQDLTQLGVKVLVVPEAATQLMKGGAFIVSTAFESASTKRALLAPRESASKPKPPEPEYKSKTRLSKTASHPIKVENIASLTISVVGRAESGTNSFRPPYLPEIIRVTLTLFQKFRTLHTI